MDSANSRPHLPPVGHLDFDKPRREEDAYPQYPSGPPPPYSHPAEHSPHRVDSIPGAQARQRTPPDSHRLHDEKEAIKQTVRQSLPSLSEALGVDSQPAYHNPLAAHVSTTSAPAPIQRSATHTSPSPAHRSYAMDTPQSAADPYASARSYYTQYKPGDNNRDYPPMDTSRTTYSDSRPSYQTQPPHSPRSSRQPTQYPAVIESAPIFEQRPSAPPTTVAATSFTYGYTPYPPKYAQPPAPASSTTIYQPSVTNVAPKTPSIGWKADSSSARFHGAEERVYGESVKRHLDMYDMDAALNEIQQSSSIMADFSRRYGNRMYTSTRSEPTLASLPSIIEVEDMMTKAKTQLEALSKIREVVVTQQVAHDLQAAEQHQERQKMYAEPPPSQSQSGMSNMENEELKGGFAGPDSKKRRGRAAPPGRCHSCNRAETPEWRRGPDGARTLCNACGLHYAKLTRKQNSANKSGPGGSSLRPKEDSA